MVYPQSKGQVGLLPRVHEAWYVGEIHTYKVGQGG
jgi:hypothetical protein